MFWYYSYLVKFLFKRLAQPRFLSLYPDTMRSEKEQIEAFRDACKTADLRLTHQRLEIYRELVKSKDHPSVERLYQRLRRSISTLSLDTVYRTLATFETHGLVNRVESVKSQARFEAAGERHHHLICNRCGKIMDFQWKTINEVSLPEETRDWGKITQKSVVIHGVCRDCLKA